VWRLIRDDHVMSCELCNESRDGFGWEVVIRQGGELSFSRRCETERGTSRARCGRTT
jgi:ribosome-binding protein aMBF1 (putative translation factor)